MVDLEHVSLTALDVDEAAAELESESRASKLIRRLDEMGGNRCRKQHKISGVVSVQTSNHQQVYMCHRRESGRFHRDPRHENSLIPVIVVSIFLRG